MSDLTILYCTSNRERPEFERRIRNHLLRAADGLPIISVVQDPDDPGIGHRICVGRVGASYRNYYRQLLTAALAAETEYVAMAEADCLYPPEFFQALPPDGVDAWIGNNLWILYTDAPDGFMLKGPSDGLLVARRDWLIERLELRLEKLPGWGPGKTRPIVGRNADMEKFDVPPIVSVKTGASLMATTPHTGQSAASLQGWGEARSLARALTASAPARLAPSRGEQSLSILIPAANEEFLVRTVADILEHAEGDTDVIVTLDGYLSNPPLPQHPRVTVIYNHESVGQRAATNQAARLSDARYVMKLDAHCAFDQGFDVKLMALMEDDITMVPTMYNLHAFDFVCPNGHRRYQGNSVPCFDCGEPVVKEMVWKPRPSRKTNAMRFDRDLRFGYWAAYEARQGNGPLVETMSLLGACWMLTRERYWALDICDEGCGSWGQQGTEVACKTWLSGGRLLVNTTTWFAHCFRTQGGDFGHPYPNPQDAVERAREYSRRLWNDPDLGVTWPLTVHPLSWLLEKFWPVPSWSDDDLLQLKGREVTADLRAFAAPSASSGASSVEPVASGRRLGIVYYTTNRLGVRLARRVQETIRASGLPIVSASLKPMTGMGVNVHVEAQPGVETMFRQILAALEESRADYVFLCEHDVVYHPSHFEFVPPRDDVFYYNVHVYQLLLDEGRATHVDDRRQTSGLCASRELLLAEYRARVERASSGESGLRIGFEPGTRDGRSEVWRSEFPNVDVRHGGNLTRTKRSPEDFRNPRYAAGWSVVDAGDVPGWDDLASLCSVEAAA